MRKYTIRDFNQSFPSDDVCLDFMQEHAEKVYVVGNVHTIKIKGKGPLFFG